MVSRLFTAHCVWCTGHGSVRRPESKFRDQERVLIHFYMWKSVNHSGFNSLAGRNTTLPTLVSSGDGVSQSGVCRATSGSACTVISQQQSATASASSHTQDSRCWSASLLRLAEQHGGERGVHSLYHSYGRRKCWGWFAAACWIKRLR